MVLLPGLDGTGKLFAPQVTGLSNHFDLRCLTIPEDNRQSWDSLAESVATLISAERNGRTTYICGESYGGCLALYVALRHPMLLDKLVLVNPASSLHRQLWARWLSQTATYVPEWLYSTSSALVFPLLANFDRISHEWQQAFVETVRPISRDCVAWRLSMLQDFRVAANHFCQIRIPTALIASLKDRLLPSNQEVETLKQFIPHAVTYRLPESGHVCLLEEAVNLSQCLKMLDFLPEVASHRV